MLSQRISKGLPLNQAVEGDVVIEVQNGELTDRYFSVSRANREKVNTQIERKKAVVSTVLIGYETMFSKGEMGDIEQRVFDAEAIDKRDFIIPDLPVASSKGTRRSIYASFSNLSYQINTDDRNSNKKKVQIQFDLKKGCYATSFLRELMKADDIRAY
jgi:tRNA pseudouridine13 synthase